MTICARASAWQWARGVAPGLHRPRGWSGRAGRVLGLLLRTGPQCPLRERGQGVHVLNGKQEGVALSVCPGPPRLRLLYRYGVCVWLGWGGGKLLVKLVFWATAC